MEPVPSTLSPSLTTSGRNHPLPPSRLPWVLPQPALRALCPGFSSARSMPGRQSVTGGVQPERQRPGCSLSSDSSWFRVGRGDRTLEARCGSAQCQIIRGRRFSPEPSPHMHVRTYL